MIDVLVLRFDAPLMSFGGAAIDAQGVTDAHPGLSLVTGLLGNALGWSHRDTALLDALQARLRVASRRDRAGERLVDYHTVDLGDPHMDGTGWTTRGAPERRRGGSASTGTHIRYRHYVSDAVVTLVLTLDDPDVSPTIAELEEALRRPARPLFLGRKTCLPSRPILQERLQAASLYEALRLAPWDPRADAVASVQWPDEEEPGEGLPTWAHDLRDWQAGVHAGARLVRVAEIARPEVARG